MNSNMRRPSPPPQRPSRSVVGSTGHAGSIAQEYCMVGCDPRHKQLLRLGSWCSMRGQCKGYEGTVEGF